MFPVVGTGTTRRNMEHDLYLGGGKLFVPRGVLVWIPMHAVQNASANWDQPERFMPERWDMVSSPSLAVFTIRLCPRIADVAPKACCGACLRCVMDGTWHLPS